jgi:hypothetical protein
MLPSMPRTAAAPEPPKSSSFASLLAGFAALTDKTKTSGEGSPSKHKSTSWNDDALEDDVAVISYEQALRTHKRTRSYGSADLPGLPPGLPPFSLGPDSTTPASPTSVSPYDEFSASGRKPPVSERRASLSPAFVNSGSVGIREWNPEAALPPFAASTESGLAAPCDTLAENRKSASITIRLSKPECTQIHRRAAAAGLTVTAYLRSGILEAESLRAQVKETLAQLCSARPAATLKAGTPALKPLPSAAPHSRSWLFPRWNWVRRTLDA